MEKKCGNCENSQKVLFLVEFSLKEKLIMVKNIAQLNVNTKAVEF